VYASDNEVRMMLRRAQLVSLDDSGSQQLLDLTALKSDRPRQVPRVMDFGFSSAPPAGADFLMLAAGGGSSRAMAIGGEHKDYRQANLTNGTAVLYDDKGNVIFAKGASGIVVKAKEGTIVVQPADGQMLFLGGDGTDGVYSPVKTVAGDSTNVLARM
jgi:phage baseplate assembly protein V